MALPRPVVNAIRLHAARGQPDERYRVVTRGVHENEARAFDDALGEIHRVHQRARCRPWPPRPAISPGCCSGRRLCCRARDCRRSSRRTAPDTLCTRGCSASTCSATARLRARRTSRCSAPKISGVSASTAVPPAAASRSEQTPSAGFAVMPENESEPPQFSPSTASTPAVRRAVRPPRVRSSARSRARAASTVPRVPPLDCSVMPISAAAVALRPQVPVDLVHLAAQPQDDGGRNVGVSPARRRGCAGAGPHRDRRRGRSLRRGETPPRRPRSPAASRLR